MFREIKIKIMRRKCERFATIVNTIVKNSARYTATNETKARESDRPHVQTEYASLRDEPPEENKTK